MCRTKSYFLRLFSMDFFLNINAKDDKLMPNKLLEESCSWLISAVAFEPSIKSRRDFIDGKRQNLPPPSRAQVNTMYKLILLDNMRYTIMSRYIIQLKKGKQEKTNIRIIVGLAMLFNKKVTCTPCTLIHIYRF